MKSPLIAALLAFALGVVATVQPASGQRRATTNKRSATRKPENSASPALAELQKRVIAVQSARSSGDSQAVTQASRALIALGLRQVAHLRLVEDALPAAIDLYKRSLDFEDNPATRVDLAITDLRAKKFDDALTEVRTAILKDAEDSRAWRIQGMAYMSKEQYGPAVDSLQRSLAIRNDLEASYQLGICLLAAHEKEKAAAVFRKMDEEAYDRGALHVLMARAYRDGAYLDDAVRELKTALQLNPNTLHAHYLLGLVYLLQEEWAPKPKIREQFQMELRLNPRDFLSTYLLGAMASNEKNFAESDKYLKAATEIQPEWSEPWLYLGLNANNRGDTKNAEMYLRKAISLNGPDDSRSNYFIRKAYFALGRILSQSDRKEEARPFLQKARELQERVQADSITNSPQTGGMGGANEAYIATADLKNAEGTPLDLEGGRDFTAELDAAALSRVNLSDEQKKSALAEEKRLRAVLGAGFNDLATSEAIRRQYDLALDHYQEAQRWDPASPGLIRNLGITAMKARKYSEAVKALSEVLSADPKDDTVRAMLGMSYYVTDQYKEAAQTIAPLGDAAVKDPGLGYAWADSLVKQQDLQHAGEVLDKLERTPLSTETLMLVGQLWENVGNHLRAVATYHKVLETVPLQPKAHYYAGVAYIRSDRPADAAGEFQAELALNPDDADAKYNLGYADLQQSKRDEAASLFVQVVTTHPEHADAQYQLGKILMDEGKVKEAISHLEIAVRLKPQADYMHYQLQAAYRTDSRIQDADRELALYKEIKAGKREHQAQGMGRD
ncbi:MAG: tetratricopeptide repeat protein [Acidobacteriia bacterium]|nr:tetratricopeptide repeat protein [Terriglobia bacterium]